MIRIVLEGEQPKSWNTYWAGVHWRKRKQERDRVHLLVRSYIDPNTAAPFTRPVQININAYFKDKRVLLDAGNIANKAYIDALVGWFITDDSPKYVQFVKTGSFLDRENPRVEIEIIPIYDVDDITELE